MCLPQNMMSNRRLVLFCLTIFSMNCVLMYLTISNALRDEYYIELNENDSYLHSLTSNEFVSFGIDASMLSYMTKEMWNNERLNVLASLLSPGYLRFGGTLSDRIIFAEDGQSCNSTAHKTLTCKSISKVTGKFLPYIILSASQFDELNRFCVRNKLKLLFDLNVLLRDEVSNEWYHKNAEELIKYSKKHNYDITWQLGNEPNSFRHVFNVTIAPQQLAADYKRLRHILNKHGYESASLVGPDTTRPQPQRPDCLQYMIEFLGNLSFPLSARSWHQYYLNSRTATLDDFWSPSTFDLLNMQIKEMVQGTKNYSHIPMWLTETSSSYGGGAPLLSNTFAGTPLWIDKLGLAALHNISVVIRQTLIGGNYSIIDKKFDPLPDWWLSMLYKHLVSNKVLKMKYNGSEYQRFYVHCALNEANSVVIFGVNLSYRRARILLNGTAFNTQDLLLDEYILNAPYTIRKSKIVTLNRIKLYFDKSLPPFVPVKQRYGNHIKVPPYSVGFWIVKNTTITNCQ